MEEVSIDIWNTILSNITPPEEGKVFRAYDFETLPGEEDASENTTGTLKAFCEWLDAFGHQTIATCRTAEKNGWLALCSPDEQ